MIIHIHDTITKIPIKLHNNNNSVAKYESLAIQQNATMRVLQEKLAETTNTAITIIITTQRKIDFCMFFFYQHD